MTQFKPSYAHSARAWERLEVLVQYTNVYLAERGPREL